MTPTLYQRDDCHLCDLALAVLAATGLPDFDSVFIDGDAALEAAYGHRVPVLRIAGHELDWPFDADRVREGLAEQALADQPPVDRALADQALVDQAPPDQPTRS